VLECKNSFFFSLYLILEISCREKKKIFFNEVLIKKIIKEEEEEEDF
jgi:hypothetical protein